MAGPAARANDMCGVVIGGNDTAAAVGADWVRHPFYWPLLETSEGSYDGWQYAWLDAERYRYARNGQLRMKKVLANIEGFADYLGTGGQYRVPCSDTLWSEVLARWQELWRVTTARYCGTIDYWGVWNEPNDMGFLQPRMTCSYGDDYCRNNPVACAESFARDYADLVIAADAGRQQGCPSAKLVVGDIGMSSNQLSFASYLLYYLQGRVYPSALGYHTYTFAVNTRQTLQNLRWYLDHYGFNGTELWVSEAGGPGTWFDKCLSSSVDPYDADCYAKREGWIRSLFQENRQYGAALKWTRNFVIHTGRPARESGDSHSLTFLDASGGPVGAPQSNNTYGSNMLLDAMRASCNTPFGFMVTGEYNDNNDLRSACYAIATNNAGYCNPIAAGNNRQLCLGMAQRSQSPCTSITDRNTQLACYGMSINYSSSCSPINDGNLRNFCFGVSARNIGYCDNVTDRNAQLLCFAMANNISSNCRDISSPNDRNFCYGVSSRNTGYCAAITGYPHSVQR